MKTFFDVEGKDYAIQYLKTQGFTNIKTTDQYCRWDLEGDYLYEDESGLVQGISYIIELKNLDCSSTKWNDFYIDASKWNILNSVEGKKFALIIFWEDKFTVITENTPHTFQRRLCNSTTLFKQNQHKIWKDQVRFDIKDLNLKNYN